MWFTNRKEGRAPGELDGGPAVTVLCSAGPTWEDLRFVSGSFPVPARYLFAHDLGWLRLGGWIAVWGLC